MGVSPRRTASRFARLPALALTVALGSTASSACTWFDEDPFEHRENEDELPEPRRIELKLERFDACRQSINADLRNARRRYDRAVAQGRKASDRDRHFGIDRAVFRTCKLALADGLSMTPPMPELEAAGQAAVEIAEEYAERTRRIGRVSNPRVEKDERLEQAYDRWRDADRLFDALIERARDRNGPVLLEMLQQKGADLEARTRAVTVQAAPLVQCLLRDDPPPDRGVCDPRFEAFELVYQEFASLMEDTPVHDVFWLDTFALDAESLFDVTKKSIRTLQDRGLTRAERRELRRTYRDLMRDDETLRFEFP